MSCVIFFLDFVDCEVPRNSFEISLNLLLLHTKAPAIFFYFKVLKVFSPLENFGDSSFSLFPRGAKRKGIIEGQIFEEPLKRATKEVRVGAA